MKVSQSAVAMERKHRRDMAKKYPQDEQKQTKPRGQTPILCQGGGPEPRRHSRGKQASFLAHTHTPSSFLFLRSIHPWLKGREDTGERGGGRHRHQFGFPHAFQPSRPNHSLAVYCAILLTTSRHPSPPFLLLVRLYTLSARVKEEEPLKKELRG